MIKIFLFPPHSDYEGGLKFLKENTNDEIIIKLYARVYDEKGFYIRKGKRLPYDSDIGWSDLAHYHATYPFVEHTLISYESNFIGELK